MGKKKEVKNKGEVVERNIENTNEERKKGSFPIIVDWEKKIFSKKGVEKDVNGTSFELSTLLDMSRVPIEEVYRAAAEHYHIRVVRKQLINVSERDALIKNNDPVDVEALRNASRKRGSSDPVKSLKNTVSKLKAQGFSAEQILDLLK